MVLLHVSICQWFGTIILEIVSEAIIKNLMKLLQISKIHVKLINPLLRYCERFAFQWNTHHFFNIQTIIQIGRHLLEVIIYLFTGIIRTQHLVRLIEHLRLLNNLAQFGLIFTCLCLLLILGLPLTRRILSLAVLLRFTPYFAFHIVNQEIYLLNIK